MPFCVYIGNTTRWPEAVDAVLLRLEGHERVEEVGHAEALVGPALEVA